MKISTISCLGLLAMLSCATAQAALQSCLVSSTGVALGAYDPLRGASTDGVGSISLVCSVSVVPTTASWDVRLSAGSSGTYTLRSMLNGGYALNYNLYTSVGYSTIWGDGSGTTSYISGSSLLALGVTTMTYVIYGRIPAGQDRPAGNYNDTIVVTVNY
jgi:spore coat protein U-like protein